MRLGASSVPVAVSVPTDDCCTTGGVPDGAVAPAGLPKSLWVASA